MGNVILLVTCFVIGILLRRSRRLPENAHAAWNGFVIHVSLPSLTLVYVHDLKLSKELLFPAAMAWMLFALGCAFFWCIGRLLKLPPRTVGALTLVPGVGKKTAERLLVELKNRLSIPVLESVGAGAPGGGAGSAVGDVREALAGLGYGADEIREALREVPASDDAATILRDALKLLGARRA